VEVVSVVGEGEWVFTREGGGENDVDDETDDVGEETNDMYVW
jgi:hypothetical protein